VWKRDLLRWVCCTQLRGLRWIDGSATFTTGVSVLIVKVEEHIAASVHQGRFSSVIAARRRRVPGGAIVAFGRNRRRGESEVKSARILCTSLRRKGARLLSVI